MTRRKHTVVLVPRGRTSYRKIRLTTRRLLALGLALIAVTAGAGWAVWTLLTGSTSRWDLEVLVTENRELREANQAISTELLEFESKLAGYEARARELAILAGLEGRPGSDPGGIGGGGPAPPDELGWSRRLDRLSGGIGAVEAVFAERQQWLTSTPTVSPVDGLLSSGYGYRSDPLDGSRRFHRGLDFSTSPGREVRATADGMVLRAGRHGALGRSVRLSHGYGLVTRYGHLADLTVSAGDSVRRGDVIGHVGISGRSTGYHLHYEVLRDGRPVDPLAYLLDR